MGAQYTAGQAFLSEPETIQPSNDYVPASGRMLAAVEVYPWSAWAQLAPRWVEVALASPHLTFFLAPEWIETWLTAYGPSLQPEILFFTSGSETVGCCLLTQRRERRGALPVRRIYLNTAGEDEHEETALEFNDLLCGAG